MRDARGRSVQEIRLLFMLLPFAASSYEDGARMRSAARGVAAMPPPPRLPPRFLR